MASIATSEEPAVNRGMITISIMLATIMTALDTTIANVALPHMAGSVSASADQITWVLTSYIIATAIMTPMTGWLAGRLGRKRVFMISIIGFTVASALCGAAQSLPEIVIFRVLQGVFGASMMPLSQAVMLDTYPIEERGPAMAVWGMGVMVAPIVGPVLGGWLTDDFSWRWVFYINLPVGVLCLLGVMTFIPDDRSTLRLPFDVMGFALLSITLAAFQLFLDRGQNDDWFHSTEIVVEASVAAVALILFVIHTATAERPFLPVALLGDRNFVTATALGFAVGLLVFSVLALLPPMLETLLGYPVITTGLVTAPRGVGSLISMFFVGRLVGRVDTRLIIMTGLVMFAIAFFGMSRFSLQMSSSAIVTTGFIQGLGTGLVFMPMTTLAFATLSPALRADGTGVFTLVRNLGNSAGISIMQALFTTNVQVVHARLVERLRLDNPLARPPYLPAPFDLTTNSGIAALEGEVTRQASMVAYIDVFYLMFLTTVVMIPLVMLLEKPRDQIPSEETLLAD
ncbi:MAG: MDR family MFS transporter [Caulobacteraceae bacterium]|nr:MDR family MFS transporter [Caulobacteraceae bacterium]